MPFLLPFDTNPCSLLKCLTKVSRFGLSVEAVPPAEAVGLGEEDEEAVVVLGLRSRDRDLDLDLDLRRRRSRDLKRQRIVRKVLAKDQWLSAWNGNRPLFMTNYDYLDLDLFLFFLLSLSLSLDLDLDLLLLGEDDEDLSRRRWLEKWKKNKGSEFESEINGIKERYSSFPSISRMIFSSSPISRHYAPVIFFGNFLSFSLPEFHEPFQTREKEDGIFLNRWLIFFCFVFVRIFDRSSFPDKIDGRKKFGKNPERTKNRKNRFFGPRSILLLVFQKPGKQRRLKIRTNWQLSRRRRKLNSFFEIFSPKKDFWTFSLSFLSHFLTLTFSLLSLPSLNVFFLKKTKMTSKTISKKRNGNDPLDKGRD